MLLSNLNLLATAPSGVARLRELILTLAVQGKLVPQDPSDEPASELLKKIRAEKDRLIAKGKIKRDKPLAEIAEEEKPFELPHGWEWVRLGEVTEILDSLRKPVTKEDRLPGPYPYYGASGIVDYVSAYLFDEPLVLVGEDGAKWGAGDKTAFTITGRTWVNNHAHVLRPQRAALADMFLVNVLTALDLSEFITGMTVPKLNQARLVSIPFALPPLAEQSRIVTRVEELMRLCDALEAKGQLEATQHAQLVSTLLATLTESETPAQLTENWHRIATHFDLLLDRPEAVDALEQTILQLAVRGLLVLQDPQDEPASALLKKIRAEKDKLIAEGKIKRDKPLPPIAEDEQPFALPMGWAWQHVSDVVEMLNGYAFKSEWFKQTGVRLLRNLNVSHGYVDWSQPAAIDAKAATEYQQFALQVGDIVLSLDRPIISTGLKYAVIRETDLPCLLLQRVARLAPDAKLVSADFLALWLQSDLFVGTIDPGRSNGVPHISTKQVGGLAFALPPLAEQSRIVTRVAQLRRLCADLRERLTASQSTQAHLAEALVREVA
jgi:type I restriction enzyme S subunit